MNDDRLNKDADDDIRGLFMDFKPDLSSDFMFMNRLEHALDSVEIVKKHNEALRARSRKAMVIAGITGFVVGVIFSLLMPLVGEFMAQLKSSFTGNMFAETLIANYRGITWVLICGASILISLNAYDLSMTVLKARSNE